IAECVGDLLAIVCGVDAFAGGPVADRERGGRQPIAGPRRLRGATAARLERERGWHHHAVRGLGATTLLLGRGLRRRAFARGKQRVIWARGADEPCAAWQTEMLLEVVESAEL